MHTLDLPNGNRTTDAEINTLSLQENRVVVSKDSDFVDSFLLSKEPYKLLLISTGNISNKDLEAIFSPLVPTIVATFQAHEYAELDAHGFDRTCLRQTISPSRLPKPFAAWIIELGRKSP